MRPPRDTLIVREGTTRSMRANRSCETSIERAFRRELWAAGERGYRKNVRKLPGSPDIVFGRQRLAVFIHGCFWHRCPQCRKDAHFATNEAFWRAKLDENVARDAANERKLLDINFRVLIVWECEIKKNPAEAVRRIKEAIQRVRSMPAARNGPGKNDIKT